MAVDDGLMTQEFLDPEAVPDDLRARAAVLFFRDLAAEWTERAAPADHPARNTAETGGTDRG